MRGTRPTRQKVFPHPTVGAPSASNSPSALSAQALRDNSKMFHKCDHYCYLAVQKWLNCAGCVIVVSFCMYLYVFLDCFSKQACHCKRVNSVKIVASLKTLRIPGRHFFKIVGFQQNLIIPGTLFSSLSPLLSSQKGQQSIIMNSSIQLFLFSMLVAIQTVCYSWWTGLWCV